MIEPRERNQKALTDPSPSLESHLPAFLEHGFCTFATDPSLKNWVDASLSAARESVTKRENQQWLRHNATWFAGVNALDNDETGAVPSGVTLQGDAIRFIRNTLGYHNVRLDRAQVSVCYPGYPQPSADETETAFGFRLRRDAAHIDGLLREGDARRRFLREHHGFILGIPMVSFSPDASPFVIWRGSHHLVRKSLSERLSVHPPESWNQIDLTDTYHALLKDIFDRCERVEIASGPGEAFVVHRLALHGTAPWNPGATCGPDGRMICFFRPTNLSPKQWLTLP